MSGHGKGRVSLFHGSSKSAAVGGFAVVVVPQRGEIRSDASLRGAKIVAAGDQVAAKPASPSWALLNSDSSRRKTHALTYSSIRQSPIRPS